MAELTREEKLKIFEKLPKELQNLMQSEDTGAFLLRLGEKYGLDDDKISLLSKLVGDIVLGITPITSLAQEINSKIATDSQVAMNLSQELYAELLSPVISVAKQPATQPQTTPQPIAQPVAPIIKPQIPSPAPIIKQQVPSADRYRESTSGMPEIVDLRKTPPSLPILPPTPSEQQNRESSIPQPNLKDLGGIGTMPISAAPMPPKPLTFTKPVEPIRQPVQVPAPTNLIEAEPHLPAKIPEGISVGESAKISPEISADKTTEEKTEEKIATPQFIIRPPGLAPTDLPHDVLDLRKDKGEF